MDQFEGAGWCGSQWAASFSFRASSISVVVRTCTAVVIVTNGCKSVDADAVQRAVSESSVCVVAVTCTAIAGQNHTCD